MGTQVVQNFENRTFEPIDVYTKFATYADLTACKFKKVGVPVYVEDEKQFYVLETKGGTYVPFGGPQMFFAEIVTYNETTKRAKVQVLDQDGQPTGEIIDDVYMLKPALDIEEIDLSGIYSAIEQLENTI